MTSNEEDDNSSYNQKSFEVFTNIIKSLADIEREWGLGAEVLQRYTHGIASGESPGDAFFHACSEWDV